MVALSSEVTYLTALDGESWPLVARIYWQDGALLDQSTTGTDGIVDVTLTVYDETAGNSTAIYAPSNLSTTAVLYASLQTDGFAAFLGDALGYNFKHLLAYNLFEVHGGRTYRVEFGFNPHSSNVYGPRRKVFIVSVDAAVGA